MEIEGLCLSLTSSEDGTIKNTRDYTSVSGGFIPCFESRSTIQPAVKLCLEIEGTGSSIVGISNGDSMIPLYCLQFKHQSSVMFTLYLKENKQEVKAAFNSETSKVSVDQEQGVKLDLKVFGGTFKISLTRNGKTFMKLNTDASETYQKDAEGKTSMSDLDSYQEKKSTQAYDDKDDELVDTKEDTEHQEALNTPVSQCLPQLINETINVSTTEAEICTDNSANALKTEKNKINTEAQSDEQHDFSNQKDDDFNDLGNMHKGSTKLDKIETVDIRTYRLDLLTRMNARRLVNYFYQAKLISEDDMEDINDSDGRRKANERLLKILRDRNVSRQNVSEVLTRAEENHLLDYMFPNEIKIKTVSTQTESYSENGSMCLQSRLAL